MTNAEQKCASADCPCRMSDDEKYDDPRDMTPRDLFAASALSGLLTRTNGYGSFHRLAHDAYQVADAMIAARAKGGAK